MYFKENNQTKKRIIEALYELLDKKDYHDITISRIVDKAALGRRTFYRYFKSKDEVIEYSTNLLMKEFADIIVLNHAETQDSIIESYTVKPTKNRTCGSQFRSIVSCRLRFQSFLIDYLSYSIYRERKTRGKFFYRHAAAILLNNNRIAFCKLFPIPGQLSPLLMLIVFCRNINISCLHIRLQFLD